MPGPGYKINIDGVNSLKKYSRDELIKMLFKAHKSLEKNILVDKVPKMKYRVQGRVYSTRKFLEVVEAHLRGHIKQVKRAE